MSFQKSDHVYKTKFRNMIESVLTIQCKHTLIIHLISSTAAQQTHQL